jgi:hypothetical protein
VAQTQRPEWMYATPRPAGLRSAGAASPQLWISVAQAPRRLAASVEPSGSNWQTMRSP